LLGPPPPKQAGDFRITPLPVHPPLHLVTICSRNGASNPSSSFFSAEGTLSWSSDAVRSSTTASNAASVIPRSLCVLFMSAP